jgi:hypothetical protein
MNVTEFFRDVKTDWGPDTAIEGPREEDGTAGQRHAMVPRQEGPQGLEPQLSWQGEPR